MALRQWWLTFWRTPGRPIRAWKPLAGSLWATALGGLYLATFPRCGGDAGMGLFGLTNILFLCRLIKATRSWGGDTQQGLAYGLLDGGGLLAAVLFCRRVRLRCLPGFDAASLPQKPRYSDR